MRRADVVHLHDSLYLGSVAAYLAARRAGKPLLVTQHIGWVPYSSRLLRGLLELANRTLGGLVLGGADRVVVLSDVVRAYFAARVRFRSAPVLVPNGVAHEVFRRRRTRRRAREDAPRSTYRPIGRRCFVRPLPSRRRGSGLLRALVVWRREWCWVFARVGSGGSGGSGLPRVRGAESVSLGQAEAAADDQVVELLVLLVARRGSSRWSSRRRWPAGLRPLGRRGLKTAAADPALREVALGD